MSAGTLLVGVGTLGAVAAVALLRFAWARPVRSVGWNAASWALLAIGLFVAAVGAGAWGIAVAALAATTAAFAILAQAGLTTPPGRAMPPTRRAHLVEGSGAPKHVVRRAVTLLLNLPVAAFVAVLIGVAARRIATAADAGAADANVLAWFVMPVAWGILMAALSMQQRRVVQGATLAVPAFLAGAILWSGGGA